MLTNQRNSLPEKKSRIISLAFLFYNNRGRERGKKESERKRRERERRGREGETDFLSIKSQLCDTE